MKTESNMLQQQRGAGIPRSLWDAYNLMIAAVFAQARCQASTARETLRLAGPSADAQDRFIEEMYKIRTNRTRAIVTLNRIIDNE